MNLLKMKKPKTAILHYRIGKTDGVSLEIIKRKKILEKLGHDVRLISGPIQESSDYVIDSLEFDSTRVIKVRHNAFEVFENFKNEKQFESYINEISESIKGDFLKIHGRENFEYLFLHNIFTHGRHIASAKAFLEIAEETKIKVVSVNHDFYWIGSYRNIYKPTNNFVRKFLQKYSPPKSTKITHVTINSINRKALQRKIGQKSTVLPDTFDFVQKPWQKDKFNNDFLQNLGIDKEDLIVLQATRISKRKGIEMALDFTKALAMEKNKLTGRTLYNGKTLTHKSRVVIILAGYAEKDSLPYKKLLEKLLRKLNLDAYLISDLIGARRKKVAGGKLYSLWDVYVHADIVTFPSIWEGWGNQLLEAVFAKKPVVLFEYPVFQSDIKKEGYNFISLGKKMTIDSHSGLAKLPEKQIKKAVNNALRLLTEPKTNKILLKNYQIAKKFHSEHVLEKKMLTILRHLKAKSSK